MLKYRIGQKITIPKLEGVIDHPRKAVVLQEYEHFYLVLTKAGYRECISKM